MLDNGNTHVSNTYKKPYPSGAYIPEGDKKNKYNT